MSDAQKEEVGYEKEGERVETQNEPLERAF